jgi:putative membrane protein
MENQTPSALQQQFPLSPKKFWKKIMAALVGCLVIGILVLGTAIFWEVTLAWEVCVGALIILLIYFLLRAWYIRAYIRRYFYSASDDFITIKKGVFAPAEIHVQYQKIQDVYVDQDILDRILGLYDVHLASATVTSGMEAHIDGVEEPAADGLKMFLLDKLRNGGRPSSPQATSTTPMPIQPLPEVAKPLDPSQMVSSDQYPIGPGWTSMQVLASFIHAFWLSVLIALWIAPASLGTNTIVWLGVAIFIIIFFGQIIYRNIWRKNFHFAFLPDYIQLSTQVLSKSEQHMPYRTIQDVIVKQGIIERMFGLATVYIQNAATVQLGKGRSMPQAVSIPGQTPDGANKIAEILRSIALSKNSANTGL